MYWFITYSWQGQDDRVLAHDVFMGSVGSWISKALDEPENWILLNSEKLTEEEYKRLKYAV